jgi:hypothetical protein
MQGTCIERTEFDCSVTQNTNKVFLLNNLMGDFQGTGEYKMFIVLGIGSVYIVCIGKAFG